jgi:hypothetical protein
MKSIYIVLTATGTLFSRCIGLYTKARYNHVSICIDSQINEFYSFGRKIIWFPLYGGFVVEHTDSGMYKAFGNTMCAIYRIDVEDNKFKSLEKSISKFIKNKKNYGYNILGLFGVIINRPLKRRNKYFCTQFVATMLQNNGIFDFGKDLSLVTPQDIYNIPNLIQVYEGKLSEMNRIVRIGAATTVNL